MIIGVKPKTKVVIKIYLLRIMTSSEFQEIIAHLSRLHFLTRLPQIESMIPGFILSTFLNIQIQQIGRCFIKQVQLIFFYYSCLLVNPGGVLIKCGSVRFKIETGRSSKRSKSYFARHFVCFYNFLLLLMLASQIRQKKNYANSLKFVKQTEKKKYLNFSSLRQRRLEGGGIKVFTLTYTSLWLQVYLYGAPNRMKCHRLA